MVVSGVEMPKRTGFALLDGGNSKILIFTPTWGNDAI